MTVLAAVIMNEVPELRLSQRSKIKRAWGGTLIKQLVAVFSERARWRVGLFMNGAQQSPWPVEIFLFLFLSNCEAHHEFQIQ